MQHYYGGGIVMSKDNSNFFKEKKVWSAVKDELLRCYLVPYFEKLFRTRIPILYIDCFAGKGKFDDGQDGSPLVAIKCLEHSLSMSTENGTAKVKPEVIMRFIELNHATALAKNLPVEYQQKAKIIEGAFENEIVNLLNEMRGSYSRLNVFLYIDPYGIKALNMNLFQQLPSVFNSAELLINLNSFGFIREALRVRKIALRESETDLLAELEEYETSIVQSVEVLNRIAGGGYWQIIVDRYKNAEIDIDQAEKEFAEQYKATLRKSFRYVLDMPIRLHPENKPKYRMIHATNHPAGCILMADNISKRHEYLVVDIQHHGQMSLFPTNIDNEYVDPEVLDKQMQDLIQSKYQSKRIGLTELQADFFDTYGVVCSSKDLSSGKNGSSLKRLEKMGAIEVTRIPAQKNGKPTRFWSEGTDQRVMINGKDKTWKR